MKWTLAHLAVIVAVVAVVLTHVSMGEDSWLEAIPLAFVSALFFFGLVAEAAWFSRHVAELPLAARRSIRIRQIECVVAAVAILLGHATAWWSAVSDQPWLESDWLDRLGWTIRGLTLGGMALALPVPAARPSPAGRRRFWLHLIFWPCVLYLLHAMAFGEWSVILVLVNVAIEAIEYVQPISQYAADSSSLYAGLNPDARQRAAEFLPYCLLSMIPVTLTTVLYLACLVRGGQQRRSMLLAGVLCLGLAACCVFPVYLARGGLRQYSPPLADATLPVSRATLSFMFSIAAIGSVWLARLCWRTPTSAYESFALRSEHLYHRTSWALWCVFFLWILSLLNEALRVPLRLFIYHLDELIWVVLGDSKRLLLTGLACRSLFLLMRARKHRSLLSDLPPTTGCPLAAYIFAVWAGTMLFVLVPAAGFWFEYAWVWSWANI